MSYLKTHHIMAAAILAALPSTAAHADNTIVIDNNYISSNRGLMQNGVFTVSGTFVSTDPQTPAITVITDQPVAIVNSIISAPGPLIEANAFGGVNNTGFHNIRVQYTTGKGTNTDINSQGPFLDVSTPTQLTVEHCTLNSTAGIMASAPGG